MSGGFVERVILAFGEWGLSVSEEDVRAAVLRYTLGHAAEVLRSPGFRRAVHVAAFESVMEAIEEGRPDPSEADAERLILELLEVEGRERLDTCDLVVAVTLDLLRACGVDVAERLGRGC